MVDFASHHHPTLFFNKSDHHLDDLQTDKKKTFNSDKAHTTSKPVLQPPQTNDQNRILKITFFSSSVRNKEKQQQEKPYLCRVCERAFTSNRALNGHMRCHSSKKGTSPFLTCQDAIDLSRFLPPKTYKTRKRSRRFFIDDDVREVAQSLLDMSCGKSLYFDADNHDNNGKRLKLSDEKARC
ncbi:unnamed protein product [Trifolium pratense]|uniref:Uncharacterized protein n=1 Tax=Trifolium pratense TaxID=57577 RepID=A0ACB0MB90_TRIPR|nr:unnamed protein product [Trifolium pratense]